MIRVTEVAFSCYPVTDMARSRAFYEGALGLKPSLVVDQEGAQFVEYEIGSHTLAIGSAPGWTSSVDGASVALEVEDFDAAIHTLKERGVPFKMEPFPTPVCRMAFILDPDGSAICIHKRHTH